MGCAEMQPNVLSTFCGWRVWAYPAVVAQCKIKASANQCYLISVPRGASWCYVGQSIRIMLHEGSMTAYRGTAEQPLVCHCHGMTHAAQQHDNRPTSSVSTGLHTNA
jgi:hypothetical protein